MKGGGGLGALLKFSFLLFFFKQVRAGRSRPRLVRRVCYQSHELRIYF